MIDYQKIVFIDDDPISNYLSERAFRNTLFGSSHEDVTTFTNPIKAIETLLNSSTHSSKRTAIFLDINMPELTGWEVLDKLLAANVKRDKLDVYMLSSGTDASDIKRAKAHPLVKEYFVKPFTHHAKNLFG